MSVSLSAFTSSGLYTYVTYQSVSLAALTVHLENVDTASCGTLPHPHGGVTNVRLILESTCPASITNIAAVPEVLQKLTHVYWHTSSTSHALTTWCLWKSDLSPFYAFLPLYLFDSSKVFPAPVGVSLLLPPHYIHQTKTCTFEWGLMWTVDMVNSLCSVEIHRGWTLLGTWRGGNDDYTCRLHRAAALCRVCTRPLLRSLVGVHLDRDGRKARC